MIPAWRIARRYTLWKDNARRFCCDGLGSDSDKLLDQGHSIQYVVTIQYEVSTFVDWT